MTPLFGIMGIGTQELMIVAVIVLVLFGHRLPTMMGSLGKGIRDFKRGLNEEEQAEQDKVVDDRVKRNE